MTDDIIRQVNEKMGVIDSLDIIHNINVYTKKKSHLSEEDKEDLAGLQDLEDQAKDYCDWDSGVDLIRESYFERYAKELAGDLGLVPNNPSWPLDHIDWYAAAEALKEDYMEMTFRGVTYYVRNY